MDTDPGLDRQLKSHRETVPCLLINHESALSSTQANPEAKEVLIYAQPRQWTMRNMRLSCHEYKVRNMPGKGGGTYLTRFSDAMTEVETALPRACNSIVS